MAAGPTRRAVLVASAPEEVMASGLTRRAVLAGAATAVPVLISGCRGVEVLGTPPPPAPDVRLLRETIVSEHQLISRYHAVLAGPAKDAAAAQRLAALLTEHEQHLAQLRRRLVVPVGSAQSLAPAATPAVRTPPDLAGALATLSAAEQAAARRLATGLLTVPPSLAQLLASISASEATHVPVLDQLRRTA
jgi:hypothetical protein